jgi:electron transport complex protein RnfG
MNKSSNWESTVKPIVVLGVIALVVSLLLALVNSMTAPVIEANNNASTFAAYVEVMPTVSGTGELESIDGITTANVTGAVRATDGSIAVKAEESGFDGGILTVILGFDANGDVTGVYVDAINQTSGIGSHVADDAVKNQFVGLNASANVAMGENGLDGYSGATFSSKALFAAVNDCINAYNEVA